LKTGKNVSTMTFTFSSTFSLFYDELHGPGNPDAGSRIPYISLYMSVA
jgi:hypothetical protein